MQEERDIVVFTDDDGNDLALEVLDYFFYNGQEYAVLSEACNHEHGEGCGCGHDHGHGHEHGEGCGCGHNHDGDDCGCCGDERDVYIMKVMPVGEDEEEFVPVEESLMETLARIVQSRFDGDDEDDDDDEDEE